MVNSKVLVGIGFVCVVLGVALPFLIITKVLESTLFLNFFSYIVSITGVFLGIIGMAMYYRDNKKE